MNTSDIAALRETAGTGEQSDWMTWPRIDPVKLKELLDQFEVVSSSEWKLTGELVAAQKQLEAAQARIAELESKQNPVAWEWQDGKQRHVTNDEEIARDLAWDGVKLTPLAARPSKPVIKLPTTKGRAGVAYSRVIPEIVSTLQDAGITVESE